MATLTMFLGTAAGASAALTPVSPADGATVSVDPSARLMVFIFDSGEPRNANSPSWDVHFSSSPTVGPDGRIASDLDHRFADGEFDSTRVYVGSQVFSPGVVYWQVSSCELTQPSCGRTGPVWKVTIAPPVVAPDPLKFNFSKGPEFGGTKEFEVDGGRLWFNVRCSADCKVSARSEVTIFPRKSASDSTRVVRKRALDFDWPATSVARSSDISRGKSTRIELKLSATQRSRLIREMGQAGTARLRNVVTATDAAGQTDTRTIGLVLIRREKFNPGAGGGSSSSGPKTLEERAEDAARQALDDRHPSYYLARCDLIGPKRFDCIARPLAGLDLPDRRANVYLSGGRWYVGTFRAIA